ncbi:DUF1353 domain-containing protein [Polynucleobacter asymbioticus]|uniref:DUF1353 domain-containing protein n=1 Tax=Polynucleobacter asymbioticus TaxID=576611 RepID=A0AAC9IQA0_9BURK|nr:DUF1353 domain-containing protein [Polynucleobacter asymbioticus]APB98500.1 hypothetical protein A4F89_03635 [Polynucleobacter asymbioticus]APC00784.1 hypothetical protein AOC25_03635 [Polynucleobacter asymbioticus]
MSQFLTLLDVEQVEDVCQSGRGTWKVLNPLVYQSDLLGTTLTVPAGFVTDFASVPRIPIAFWFFGDRANQAATLHDWLYTTDSKLTHPVRDRETADAILKEASLAQGVPTWVAYALWAGVRIGGESHWV